MNPQVVENDSSPGRPLARIQSILWCCLIPNGVVTGIAAGAWLSGAFSRLKLSGLEWLTRQRTLEQVQDVVGIGPIFVFLLLLSLILVPNLLISLLVSGRGFERRWTAFASGCIVCLAIPTIGTAALTVMQSRLN